MMVPVGTPHLGDDGLATKFMREYIVDSFSEMARKHVPGCEVLSGPFLAEQIALSEADVVSMIHSELDRRGISENQRPGEGRKPA